MSAGVRRFCVGGTHFAVRAWDGRAVDATSGTVFACEAGEAVVSVFCCTTHVCAAENEVCRGDRHCTLTRAKSVVLGGDARRVAEHGDNEFLYLVEWSAAPVSKAQLLKKARL